MHVWLRSAIDTMAPPILQPGFKHLIMQQYLSTLPSTDRLPAHLRLNECWIKGPIFLLSPLDQPLLKRNVRHNTRIFEWGSIRLMLKTQVRQAPMLAIRGQTCFSSAYSSISTLHSWIWRLFLMFINFKISIHIKLIPTIKWSFCL